MNRPTPSQQVAIHAADHHVLVAAGAGTGKTSTVVARILYLLGVEVAGGRYASPVSLDRIGAITYTNAAAADLKRKLRDELRIAGRREDAYRVDSAHIGTIHGFCGDLLRETALRAGRAPGLEVLEEGESAALAAEATADALLECVADGRVEGLEDLLARHRQDEVRRWAARLAGDGDRLARFAGVQDHGPAERALLALAREARALLERRLEERGAVDFDRMITRTRDLLRDNDSVRRRIRARLHTLIVDEFQDVDPAQKEIAWLLGDPAARRDDTTRLMLVGDPKQSIYRFRRADVAVWRTVQQAFEGDGLGRVVALQDNFRSVAPILAFVDATVGQALDAPIGGARQQEFEVAYQPVRPVPATAGPADRAVELLVTPALATGYAPNADLRRAAEAAAVARRARELHESGVALKDMALLFATMTDAALYEDALRREQLKTYSLRGEGFYDRREVVDLLLALEVVRDPRNDAALVGFLRSPFVGLRDEALLELAWQGPSPRWDTVRGAQTSVPALLGRGVALIEEHAALRDRVPVYELLESLLERSGYLGHLALQGEGAKQALANVRKFLRLARRQAESPVGDFLRSVQEMRARKDREGDERLHGVEDDVLLLTTVHSAKGLEWRVVFWCDTERAAGGGGWGQNTLLTGRDAIAIKDPDASEGDPALDPWLALEAREEAEADAEQKRLWYVAATRARERLIVSGVVDGKRKGRPPRQVPVAALRVPAVDGAEVGYTGRDGATFTATTRLAPMVPDVEPQEPADGWADPLPGSLPPQVKPLAVPTGPARHSATSLMAQRRCPRRHWLRYVMGLKEPSVERAGQGFLGAIARGQIVHEVLEQMGEARDTDALLEAAIGRWDDSTPPPDTEAGVEVRDMLREEIRQIADRPEYRALADNPTNRRELGFVNVMGADVHIEGKFDLAAYEGAGIALLDVKTAQGDAEHAASVARNYDIQRSVYVTAAEAIGGLPVARFAFQFSRAGVQLSTPMDDAQREAARREVAQQLEAIGSGEAPLTAHPAECGYCGFKRAGWCPGVNDKAG